MLRRSLRIPLLATLVALCFIGGGCKKQRTTNARPLGPLEPPRDAPAWESRFAVAFDDSYTPTTINLQGRAPNDILDQQLFHSRLGHAAVVVLVRVEQVWEKDHRGQADQFMDFEVGEVLLGRLPDDTPKTLTLEINSVDELSGDLKDEVMLLFLRWDAEADPPYHLHLMPAGGHGRLRGLEDDDLVGLIMAMVKHAQAEGVLNAQGEEPKRKRRRRSKKHGASEP